MERAKKGKELSVLLGDRIGAGAGLFGKLRDAEINVVASCCYQIGDEAHLTFVVEDSEGAGEVLRRYNLEPRVQDVLLVQMPNRPGEFARVMQQISRLGINVLSAYATTTVPQNALAVIKTDDDDRTLEQLNSQPEEEPTAP